MKFVHTIHKAKTEHVLVRIEFVNNVRYLITCQGKIILVKKLFKEVNMVLQGSIEFLSLIKMVSYLFHKIHFAWNVGIFICGVGVYIYLNINSIFLKQHLYNVEQMHITLITFDKLYYKTMEMDPLGQSTIKSQNSFMHPSL